MPPTGQPRVRVFIDGQNLFKGMRRVFKGRVHPLLLGRELAGSRELVGVDYYSGIHDPDENRSMFDLVRRRHELMERTGVRVHERRLRYHWEWRVDDDNLPRPWENRGDDRRKARVKRTRAAREKGVDVALSLDAVAAAFTGSCDVVIIVSRDRDLMEIAAEINTRAQTRDVAVEVAFVQERREPLELPGYERRQLIDGDIVDRCRDTFDYSRPLDEGEVAEFLAGL